MSVEFLENLQKNNEFPIIFIGSGITRRYFDDAPTWDKLLTTIWDETSIEQKYYSKYNQLMNEYSDKFDVYTK